MASRRLYFFFPILFGLLALTGCGPTPEQLGSKIAVEQVEIVPYQNDKGEQYQAVVPHFRNNNAESVGTIYARLVPYDEQGNVIESEVVDDYCLFAARTVDEKILPGQTKRTYGSGFLLDGIQRGIFASRVIVQPLRAGKLAYKEEYP